MLPHEGVPKRASCICGFERNEIHSRHGTRYTEKLRARLGSPRLSRREAIRKHNRKPEVRKRTRRNPFRNPHPPPATNQVLSRHSQHAELTFGLVKVNPRRIYSSPAQRALSARRANILRLGSCAFRRSNGSSPATTPKPVRFGCWSQNLSGICH